MVRGNKTLYLLLAGGLLLTACAKKEAASFARPPAPVTVATATAQDVPFYLDEVGHTVAREVVSVQPQVSGTITEIHFTDGADLKKGDPLFTIDPRPFQAQLNAAEANLAQSKAALDYARIEFGRVKDLVESRAIARQDYDTRKNAVDVGEAQVAQNEAAVESAKLNLEYTSIKSPIDGRAGHRLVDPGNVVTANTTTLLTIERMDPIYAEFTTTEGDFSQVQQSSAKHPLRVEVRLPDDTKPTIGELTFLDNSVQSSSGTVSLRATVPNPSRHLWPGQFVNVRLVLTTIPKAVLVPAAATQDSAKGPFVFVVKSDDTAELRPIKLGQRQGEMVVVADGLQPGDRVVLNGQLGVMPGAKVQVVTNPAPAPAPGAASAPAGKS